MCLRLQITTHTHTHTYVHSYTTLVQKKAYLGKHVGDSSWLGRWYDTQTHTNANTQPYTSVWSCVRMYIRRECVRVSGVNNLPSYLICLPQQTTLAKRPLKFAQRMYLNGESNQILITTLATLHLIQSSARDYCRPP